MKTMKNDNGFTILEIIIGVGITSLIALFIGTLVTNSQKSSNSIFRSLDEESVRNRIRLNMSCEKTINQISSTDGENSILFNSKDQEIFPTEIQGAKTIMVAGDFNIWMKSYDASTGELELISINQKTNIERPLFRGVSFFCPI